MRNHTLLTGSLSFIGLADIFQILGGNSSTGELRITSQYSPYPGTIYFVKGNPVNAACGPLKGIKAIYALFGWAEGIFEFHQEDVTIERLINKSRMEIVLDALRMFDDGEIKKVGPPSLDAEAPGRESGSADAKGLPVIRGPLLDYSYVVKEEYFTDGAAIVNEGSHGKWMWIVYEGVVKVSRETPNGPIEIARLGEGSFIGTFKSLLFGEYTRSASVAAEGDVRLCLMDSEHLYSEFTSLSQGFRNLLISLDERLRKVNDTIVDLYGSSDGPGDILKNRKMFLKKGSTQGDLFIIRQGQAFVTGQTRNSQIPILTLGKDDILGNFQFMDFGHEPRSTSVMTTEDFKADKLDTASLQKEYDGLSNTFKNLIYHLCICISQATGIVLNLHKNR